MPLRCPYIAHEHEHRIWAGELYHDAAGNKYVPVVKKLQVCEVVDGQTVRVVGERQICDEEATLKGPPVQPPEERVHFHVQCHACGNQWVVFADGESK